MGLRITEKLLRHRAKFWDSDRVFWKDNALMQKCHVSQTTLRRRRFIEKYLKIGDLSILEIGPLTTPTYTPQDASVKYMDWFSREELTRIYREDSKLNVADIIDVDYVIKERRFSEFIRDTFDLVIANHIMEHIPDVIAWIQELQKILSEDGSIFLSVPEKKYTFDFLRHETTAVEILRCFHEKLDKPSYYQILAGIYHHRPITPTDNYWTKIKKVKSRPISFSDAMEEADRAQGFHTGGFHCHVFSRKSFPNVWSDLLESGLIEMEITEISRIMRDVGEFHVLLRPRTKKDHKLQKITKRGRLKKERGKSV
jgi:SAM-dependent methyltransferase